MFKNFNAQVSEWKGKEEGFTMRYGKAALFVVLVLLVTVQGSLAEDKVLLAEGFEDITTLGPAGWVQTNHSEPPGSTSWFQGNLGVYPPYEGAGYIAANFNNTAGTGTISNWLISPPLELSGIDEISFWTNAAWQFYPDRLEVRLSKNGTSTDVGTTSTDVGDFSILLLSINPSLLQYVYPETWTEFVIDSVNAGGTGRIAFRYFVTNGGPTGTNSNYIGIDSFKVTYKFPWPMYLQAITGNKNN